MRLASWNVNGLRAVMKKGALVSFLASQQPDLLCLQEVKIKPEQVDFTVPGYQLILNSAERAGYAGTGVLIRDDVYSQIDTKNILRNLPSEMVDNFAMQLDQFGSPNDEGRVLGLDLGDYYLITVYTPNSKSDLSRLSLRYEKWDPAFLAYMNKLRQIKPVVFCGDLNVAYREIDLANPKQNIGKHGFTDQERQGFGNIIRSGFTDSFRKVHGDEPNQYTWWSHWARARERNIGWRIDYFLVDDRLASDIIGASIYPNQMGSDHCPISVEIK